VLLAGTDAPASAPVLASAWEAVPEGAHADWRRAIDELAAAHHVAPLSDAADVLDATAEAVVRIWARWLRGFERSSVQYLLDELVLRPGVVTIDPQRVTVELARRPLDTLLEVAGYLRPIEALPGVADRRVDFVVGPP
jgi:hypothetical protein